MINLEIVIEFSNGCWRSVKELVVYMGFKNFSDILLKNLYGVRGIFFEVYKNGDGYVIWYCVYYIVGKLLVELVKVCKVMGLVVGLELISILGGVVWVMIYGVCC